MKKYLLSESGSFYKANLHCHSTFSDGKSTPEEIKKHYVENGYSVVSFTDHNVFIPHDYLNDDSFLALNGLEINVNELSEHWQERKKYHRTCHMCFVALRDDIDAHPLWNESMNIDKSRSTYKMTYTPECISEIMKIGMVKGFFVTYNHPKWSNEKYERYMKYENMNAIEIYNHECFELGCLEYNPEIYDDMLKGGKKIYALATDDLHRIENACGGYVMIKADKLDYPTIAKALKDGQFYSSTGADIYSLLYDTDTKTVHVETSKAERIICSTGIRCRHVVTAKSKNCEYLNSASFVLNGDEKFFRITVIDNSRAVADTNAYFLADFYE